MLKTLENNQNFENQSDVGLTSTHIGVVRESKTKSILLLLSNQLY